MDLNNFQINCNETLQEALKKINIKYLLKKQFYYKQ